MAAAAGKYAPVGIAAAAMAVLGLWGLARDSSMGNDEVATRWAALLSLRDLAHLLNTVDAVHGLYYLVMHVWVAVGTSPTVLRIPSVLAMIVAVALTAILGRRLTGSGWVALFSGLVMALTPVITYYAQTARSYAMVVTCVLGATLVLLRALNAEVTGAAGTVVARRWVAYGALVTLGGYLNELSLLIVAAHAVTVLLARYGRRTVRHWAAAAAVGAGLVLPLVVISIRESGAVHWITRPGLAELRILFQDYFGATTAAAVLVLACAIVAVLPPDGWWRRRRASAAAGQSGAGGARAAARAGWCRREAPSPPGGAVAGSACPPSRRRCSWSRPHSCSVSPWSRRRSMSTDMSFTARRERPCWRAPGCTGSGAGCATRRTGERCSGCRAWSCARLRCCCRSGRSSASAPRTAGRTTSASVSKFVGAHARTGDGVLFFGTFYRKARLGYPADFAKISDFAMKVSPEQAGTFRGRNKPFALTEPLMLAHQRIWVIGAEPSGQLPPGEYQAESLELEDQLRPDTQTPLPWHDRHALATSLTRPQ